ncbi:hypothetical protein I315_02295 [Cryptococcus gattii Ru294]|uniref:Uncharacterized protein n=2 Tax=Cryptococcus gattii TaxID=37769 RepID=E6RDL8_CRYGW|nr:uncharacterized protein CGB_K2430W [Cryptococcus gattii WM276]KIR55058.1 hypothetical protein I315_02295 [Cryptococcus gattii Ru294]KIR79168.1 hypothetical protein I306_03819 [Cryptococcus gattii EJB2]KIY35330.1 hypothetical protein I305_02237 [Cryptococcus gattii E566]KJE05794.1 hypothetical protein I311_00520 [Cryptococcus gattii NT-10]ADV24902.1 Conserved hypothetical protein [Cryptococcus gattii WM276]
MSEASQVPPQSASLALQNLPPRNQSLRRRPSAREAVDSFVSPLARLEIEGRIANGWNTTSESYAVSNSLHRANLSQDQPSKAPPIPALEFNLFRHSSILSIDSLASECTVTGQQNDEENGMESPVTPKAISSGNAQPSLDNSTPTETQSSSKLTSSSTRNGKQTVRTDPKPMTSVLPIRSLSLSSHPSITPSTARGTSPTPFKLGPVPPRRTKSQSKAEALTREAPVPLHPKKTEINTDWASVHGEEGSEWGKDESQFEWLDTRGIPQAINGIEDGGGTKVLGPSRRLSKLKATMSRQQADGVQSKLKKPIIIPKRAPPPPPNSAPAPPIVRRSSRKIPRTPPIQDIRRMNRQASDSSIPLRPAHPPYRQWSDTGISSQSNPTSPQIPSSAYLTPRMVPVKNDNFSSVSLGLPSVGRFSQMSSQSGYSFYDLEGDSSPSTSKAESEFAFPRGKYTKVSASALEEKKERRKRVMPEPIIKTPGTPVSVIGRTASDLVCMGIEARGKGELPKSAYYFMKAAEAGNSTGKIYWGLALRYGLGVGIDDKRAFAELSQACDASLAEEGLTIHTSPGRMTLTAQERKKVTDELAIGMFEVGNCFLGGIGVKKAPDVALQYLRFAADLGDLAAQEQLGFVLSKGSNGIKKDMKEAAKWYRMAIAQGSSNTVGLSWVWKEKYMS